MSRRQQLRSDVLVLILNNMSQQIVVNYDKVMGINLLVVVVVVVAVVVVVIVLVSNCTCTHPQQPKVVVASTPGSWLLELDASSLQPGRSYDLCVDIDGAADDNTSNNTNNTTADNNSNSSSNNNISNNNSNNNITANATGNVTANVTATATRTRPNARVGPSGMRVYITPVGDQLVRHRGG